jgi:hypothetical protein
MGHRGCEVALGKNRMCCSYQNRTADLSAPIINTVLSFINIVITDLKFSGLDCELLSLKEKRQKFMQQI